MEIYIHSEKKKELKSYSYKCQDMNKMMVPLEQKLKKSFDDLIFTGKNSSHDSKYAMKNQETSCS